MLETIGQITLATSLLGLMFYFFDGYKIFFKTNFWIVVSLLISLSGWIYSFYTIEAVIEEVLKSNI